MAYTTIPLCGYPIATELLYRQGPGQTSLLMDATGEAVGMVLQAPKTGNISKFYFRTGTVTTGDTILGSLQDVDVTTGNPDGTPDQSGTVVVANGDDDVWKTITLGAARAVTQGDVFAVVLDFNSYVAGNLNILCHSISLDVDVYPLLKTGGTWAKQGRGSVVVIEYDDTIAYVMPGVAAVVVTSVDYASDTAGADEYALKVVPTAPIRVAGIGWYGRMGGNTDLVLYDSGGTAQRTVSFDKDIQQDANTSLARMTRFASYDVAAGATIRAAVKPTTTTAIRLYYGDLRNTSDMTQQLGVAATECQMTKRVDGGAWTDVNTQLPGIFLLIDGIDTGGTTATLGVAYS